MNCENCKIHAPDKFIQQFLQNHEEFRLCPDCALKTRNKFHGLPADTPFAGEMANELWEDFQQWKQSTKPKEEQ